MLYRQDLLREADRERLLVAGRPPRAPLRQLLARTGRLLIAIGTWLESRHAPIAASPRIAFWRRLQCPAVEKRKQDASG